MDKLLASASSALLAMSLVGLLKPLSSVVDDDGPVPHAKQDNPSASDPAPKASDKPNQSDPAEELRQAYALLRRLRRSGSAGTADGRPREWSDRAARLYRVGVSAYQSGNLPQAQAYGAAAHELARAVELARNAAASEMEDPDLPTPPGSVAIAIRLPRAADVPDELPPPLAKDGEKTERQVGKRSFRLVVPRAPLPRVKVGADDAADRKASSRQERIEDEVKQLQGKIKEVREKVRRQHQEGGDGQDLGPQQREIQEATREIERVVASLMKSQAGANARQELRKAYNKIRQTRERYPAADVKFYLDAASDLYNAARHDAEAGRYERATELARAAIALTLVPENLASLPDEKSTRTRRVETKNRQTIVRHRVGSKDPSDDEVKDGQKAEAKDADKKAPTASKVERRYRIVRPGADGKERVEEEIEVRVQQGDGGHSEQVVGIGVGLRPGDNGIEVARLVPEGPADRDGRLKVGDRIVGIENQDGRVIEFGDKPMTEVSRLIRGPKGSKIKIVVLPSGSTERKTYELTRETLKLPAAPAGADDGKDDDGKRSKDGEDGSSPPDDDDLPPPLFD